LHKGERISAAAVMGKADLTEVITAVTNAELTLQTATSVRDKVVQAYQEILRMPI
jgi:flagellar hook-basal body complex protein FliE